MTHNKFIPDSFQPISARLLVLLQKFSTVSLEGNAKNSKIKRTYLNPSLNEEN